MDFNEVLEITREPLNFKITLIHAVYLSIPYRLTLKKFLTFLMNC